MRTILLDNFTPLAIIMWVCLLVTTLGDLFSRTDLCIWKKAVWAVAVVTVPMGALLYMAVQTRAITDRKSARLLQADCEPQFASCSGSSDEVAQADHLAPIIQHAIEIRGILEAEDSSRMMAETDQVERCDQKATSEHVCARALDPIRPGHRDSKRSPVMAA